MPPKKKLPLKEVNGNISIILEDGTNQVHSENIHKIIEKIQEMETNHNKYLKELEKLYLNMEHSTFMEILIEIISAALSQPDEDPFTNLTLKFICKFLAIFDDEVEITPCKQVFNWILSSDGSTPHMKFRLCQLVNTLLSSLGPDAALDDSICEKILHYMTNRLKNSSPNVRAQAIYALQRLQDPLDVDDVVIKYFIYHLQSDPSSKVRQAVITTIARTVKTIPYIIERLWDIDEKVRRHTYLQMCSYPVRSYRLEHRVTFLEQGLNDEKSVKRIVTHVMIPQWIQSYNNNYIAFLSGLKLNASEEELLRFQKVAKLSLIEIIKREKLSKIIEPLEFDCSHQTDNNQNSDSDAEDENSSDNDKIEFKKCIPIEKLTIEYAIFWSTLVEYSYNLGAIELDLILPELTTYCEYLTKICKSYSTTTMDDWQKLEWSHLLKNLVDILKYFDLCDEIGKGNLKEFIVFLLQSNVDIHEETIETIVRRTEEIIPDKEDRFQFLCNIIRKLYKPSEFEFISDRPIVKQLLQGFPDSNIQVKISQLKVDIMELQEQSTNFLSKKEYENAEKIEDTLTITKTSYLTLLEPIINRLPEDDAKLLLSINAEKSKPDTIRKCLKLIYFMVASEKVSSLTIGILPMYNDFIRRKMDSKTMDIRSWALKCAITFGILCEKFSRDVFMQMKKQFYTTQNASSWEAATNGVFSLLVRYGLKHFDIVDRQKNKSLNATSKSARQLFRGNNTDYLSQDDEEETNESTNNLNLLTLLSHLLNSCTEKLVTHAIIEGYCLLCIHSTDTHPDIISKLILKYFDPATDEKARQMLGVFFKTLLAKGKQAALQEPLIPTVRTILDATNESTLSEVKPSNLILFVLNATKPDCNSTGINLHNFIGRTFLKEIHENIVLHKELVKLLASELQNLSISDDSIIRKDLENLVDEILQEELELEPKVLKNIQTFKSMLNYTHNPKASIGFSSTRIPQQNNDDNEDRIDEENVDAIDEEEIQPNLDVVNDVPQELCTIDEISNIQSEITEIEIEKSSSSPNKSPRTKTTPKQSQKSPNTSKSSPRTRKSQEQRKSTRNRQQDEPIEPIEPPVIVSPIIEPAYDENLPQVAPTFGVKNTPGMKNLRKSLNNPQISTPKTRSTNDNLSLVRSVGRNLRGDKRADAVIATKTLKPIPFEATRETRQGRNKLIEKESEIKTPKSKTPKTPKSKTGTPLTIDETPENVRSNRKRKAKDVVNLKKKIEKSKAIEEESSDDSKSDDSDDVIVPDTQESGDLALNKTLTSVEIPETQTLLNSPRTRQLRENRRNFQSPKILSDKKSKSVSSESKKPKSPEIIPSSQESEGRSTRRNNRENILAQTKTNQTDSQKTKTTRSTKTSTEENSSSNDSEKNKISPRTRQTQKTKENIVANAPKVLGLRGRPAKARQIENDPNKNVRKPRKSVPSQENNSKRIALENSETDTSESDTSIIPNSQTSSTQITSSSQSSSSSSLKDFQKITRNSKIIPASPNATENVRLSRNSNAKKTPTKNSLITSRRISDRVIKTPNKILGDNFIIFSPIGNRKRKNDTPSDKTLNSNTNIVTASKSLNSNIRVSTRSNKTEEKNTSERSKSPSTRRTNARRLTFPKT